MSTGFDERSVFTSKVDNDNASCGHVESESGAAGPDGGGLPHGARPPGERGHAGGAPEGRHEGGAGPPGGQPNKTTLEQLGESRRRAAANEARQGLESNRQETFSCPRRVEPLDYEVVPTLAQGDCFFDAVSRMLAARRVTDESGIGYETDVLRAIAAAFFSSDPTQLSSSYRELYDDVSEILVQTLASFEPSITGISSCSPCA